MNLAQLVYPGDYRKGLLALWIAYFDESGTHKGSRWMSMGGFVGEAEAWAEFEIKWAEILETNEISFLHTKDISRFRKQFAGWDIRRRDLFIRDFGLSFRQAVFCGRVTAIDFQAFNKIFPAGEIGGARDSAYGVGFRASTAHVLKCVKRFSLDPVSFVLEDGSPNAGGARSIFKTLKTIAPSRGLSIDDLAFAGKLKYGALQAADFLTYVAREDAVALYSGGNVSDMFNQFLIWSGADISVQILGEKELTDYRSMLDKANNDAKEFGRRRPKLGEFQGHHTK